MGWHAIVFGYCTLNEFNIKRWRQQPDTIVKNGEKKNISIHLRLNRNNNDEYCIERKTFTRLSSINLQNCVSVEFRILYFALEHRRN